MNGAAWYDSKGFLPLAGECSAAPVLGPERANGLLQGGQRRDFDDCHGQGLSIEAMDDHGFDSTDESNCLMQSRALSLSLMPFSR